MSAVAVSGLTKAYEGQDALRGISFDIAEGEVFGLLGPERRRQDDDGRDPRGVQTPRRGRGVRPRRRSRGRRRRLARPDRHRPPVVRDVPAPQRASSTSRLFAGYYAAPRDPDEVITLVGLQEKRDALVKIAVGRSAAEARPRARSHRRPRAPLPRRADDGVRPCSAAGRVGDDPFAPRAREDGAADDALPRRGRAARRPRGRPPRRRDRRARHARGARRRARDGDPVPPRRTRHRRSRPTSRRASCTS